MFTPEERALLRSDLLDRAASDSRISGIAITGSAANGREDQWSDIDLAFGIGDAASLPSVLSDWTEYMYQKYLASHHLDVMAGQWTYRVFLLPNTLQVDLALVPATEFRALAPTFRLVAGEAQEPKHAAPPAIGDITGMGWLYALHARSCIARGTLWQAEFMVSGVRDNALALACIRHGLPAVHGRGMDLLPAEVTAPFKASLVRELETAEVSRAFGVAIDGLLREIRNADGDLALRLEKPLATLKSRAD